MRTIFYATDRTEHSVPALKYAYDLSTKLNASLLVIYVHDMDHLRISVSRPVAQMEYHVIKEQSEILTSYCTKHLGVAVDNKKLQIEVIQNDSVSNAILEKTKDVVPDMIIIGRKDKHTDRGLIVGNIGTGLQEKVPCPLLIIPNTIKENPIKTILYATDFEEADILALKKLVPWAKTLGAKIHIVHISTEKEYSGKEQMEWFKEMLQKEVDDTSINFALIFSDKIQDKLKVHANIIGADLLVLLEREEKGFFQKIFHKSLVAKMEEHIAIPLLSYNELNL
ncbi:universal stress protein [Arenibacter sp. TNZ]|jgi:nucleotide-binding universal stress UspA family protein|uniref:universal stress protein n=1 Tax=Arenibacter TaxID=178469 RepID=UPI000CD48738|nr:MULTISPECIES: universal stress protein [Arenibacter]MCM4173907.1 universal stress protein [Arenibacter sp. TNZ]